MGQTKRMPSQSHEDSPGCGNARERNCPRVQWLWCCLGAVFPALTIQLSLPVKHKPCILHPQKVISSILEIPDKGEILHPFRTGSFFPIPARVGLSLLQDSAKMLHIPGSLTHPFSPHHTNLCISHKTEGF